MPLLRTNGGNVRYTSKHLHFHVYPKSADPHPSRIITDRYALPKGSYLTKCNPADQSFCGGTWSTIKDNLDYIQNAGFTASAHASIFFASAASNHVPPSQFGSALSPKTMRVLAHPTETPTTAIGSPMPVNSTPGLDRPTTSRLCLTRSTAAACEC